MGIKKVTNTKTLTDGQHTGYWSLYLLNLLLMPGFAALILTLLIMRSGITKDTQLMLLAMASNFVLLVIIPGLFWLLVPQSGMFWVVFICYWVMIHAGCILGGVFGLMGRQR